MTKALRQRYKLKQYYNSSLHKKSTLIHDFNTFQTEKIQMSIEKLDKPKVTGYLKVVHTNYPAFNLGGIEKYDLKNVVVHQI